MTWFGPNGFAAQILIENIDAAASTLDISCFKYQAGDIHYAILTAAERHVTVRLLLDRSNEFLETVRIDALRAAGAQVRFDKHEPVLRQTYCLIDQAIVFTGNYTYTYAAEHRDATDLCVTDDVDTVREYGDNFETHWAHATYQ